MIQRWLNVNDIKYQEIIITLRKVISTYIECMGIFYDASVLEKECMHELLKQGLSSQSLDRTLIEVLYYEQKIQQKKFEIEQKYRLLIRNMRKREEEKKK